MTKRTIMVNGQPGKMATIITAGIARDSKYDLLSTSLTGPDQIDKTEYSTLIQPQDHDSHLRQLRETHNKGGLYAIDFSKGEGVADRNAEMYIKHKIPFVMGSTGVSNNYKDIERMAEEAEVPCVTYPNMDQRIIAWMSGIEHMAKTYSGAFAGANIRLSETHQADKKDTSGTMKAMLTGLGRLVGTELTKEDILKIREPMIQANLLEVPNDWIGWHAYHFLKIYNQHDGVEDSEELTFKRHGGECYRLGTMQALNFLIEGKNTKHFNTMVDVLKAG